MRSRAWAEWQNPDFVAKDGEPIRLAAEAIIRFATNWIIRSDKGAPRLRLAQRT